ncbi:MAG: integrin alpha [Planctomycetota bacterium]
MHRSICIVVAAVASGSTWSQDGGSTDAAVPLREGPLRHTQLLEVVEGSHLTFATSARMPSGTSRIEVHRVPLDDEPRSAFLGAPQELLDLRFDVLDSTEPVQDMSWTWLSEPPWHVLPRGDGWRYVAFDQKTDRLHVGDPADGDQETVVDDVDRLLDTRAVSGRTQCLVASGNTVELLEIDAERAVRRRRALVPFEGSHVNACFPSPLSASDPRQEALVVSWRDGSLLLQRVDLRTGASTGSTVPLAPTRPDVLRVAAWVGDDRARVAVGLPADRQGSKQARSTSSRGVGRVAVLAYDAEQSRVLHESFPPGMTPEDLEGEDKDEVAMMGVDFGTTVTFVADRDGDSVPDLAIGAPGWMGGSRLFVLSTERGRTVTSYRPEEFVAYGACPTVDATGRILFVMGPCSSYPELLHSGSIAELLDLGTGRRLLRLVDGEE